MEDEKNDMKRYVLAFDSFKGTMDADEVTKIVEAALLRHDPASQIRAIPLADGGEGFTETCLRLYGGRRVTHKTVDPLERPVEAFYAALPDGTGAVEMASCCGLPLMGRERDPLHASTYGLGQLLRRMESDGVTKILLGLGGSATNDGGIGMAAALGYQFLNAAGESLRAIPENLSDIVRIIQPKKPWTIPAIAACDVDNPLTGENGATYVFGPQKGVAGEMRERLDAGLQNLALCIKKDLCMDVSGLPGAGAAGGLGAGVAAFLHGTLLPGIELILDAAGIDDAIRQADYVLTGEGRIDAQSAHGKVPVGVARRAKAAGVPCIALCGVTGEGFEKTYAAGIRRVYAASPGGEPFEMVKRHCRETLRALAERVAAELD